MSFSRTPATWFLTEALFLVTLSLMCALAFAQSTGEPARGTTPPGSSQGGSGPADGAITASRPSRIPGESAEMRKRCDEMTGSLRDECLDKDRGAAGATTAPRSSGVLKK